MSRLALLMLVSLLATAAGAQPPQAPPTLGGAGGAAPVGNGVVQVAPIGKPGAYTGFTLTAEGAEVARVLFCSDGALTARAVQASKGGLRFSGLACAPTPALGPGSFVEVRLLPDDPYPEVRFQLDLQRFDKAAWEKRFGKVPFHFLTCSQPGSEVFHQRGWMIGTPVIDDYIQRKAIGPGRTVVSSWSRDWMYAPPIGAYPMAVAGLWNPSERRYVGYDFHGARLTEHTEKRAQILAEEAMVREMAKLEPLFAAMSGHVAILPSPDLKSPRSNAVVKMLDQARLTKHVRLLTAEELVDPAVFNGRSIWVALYLGGEAYYQSVHRPGDGEEALLRWLKGGGTLVSLAGGPFPFYYNEKDKPVVAAPRLGLPICGSGALDRLDTLDAADVRGWEKPPADLSLTMHVSPTQKVLTGLPKSIPWKTDWDQRWRPLANVVGKGNTYTPLITLKDAKGKSYGEAAAMIDYATGDLAGARVLYLWHALRLDPATQRTLVCSLLRYLLTNTRRPLGEYACLRAGTPPAIDGKLDDEIWRQTPATDAFVRFDPDRAKGRTLKTTARMAWDDRNLYVAWECEDPDVWSEITQRDGNLWEGEVVEVYVDPEGDGLDYRELEINPRNTVIDLRIPRSVKGVPQDVENARLWNAEGWRTAVQVDGTLDNRGDTDRGWTAETAIPLAALLDSGAPPKVGDVWRVQLLRIDRSKSLPAPQYSAWSDTDTFHNPGRFGRVVFVANPCADDFSAYTPGAPPTPTWVVTGGEWRVEEGVLVGRNSGSDGWSPTGVVPVAARWGDCRVRLRFQVRERGGDHRDGAWIGLRYTAPNECYSLNFGSVVQLHKLSQGRSSGDTRLLASASWANDAAWHEAAITLRGPRITVDLDGKPLLDIVDKDFLGVPPLQAGGLCLSARRWTASKADTVVAYDDVHVDAIGGR